MKKIENLKTPDRFFVDAQEMAVKHPETFYAPSADELNAIAVDDHIKVSCGNERFWVQITERIGENILVGKVDNNLVCSDEHNLFYGDVIAVETKNVYDVLKADYNPYEE